MTLMDFLPLVKDSAILLFFFLAFKIYADKNFQLRQLEEERYRIREETRKTEEKNRHEAEMDRMKNTNAMIESGNSIIRDIGRFIDKNSKEHSELIEVIKERAEENKRILQTITDYLLKEKE